MFKVENLVVDVGNVRVLKGVSLVIEDTEIAYLMGPNGAGKSTLIHVVAGWGSYRVDRGRVLLDNVDVLRLKPEERARRGIAVAFQKPPVLEGVRVGWLITRLVELHWGVSRLEAIRVVSRLVRVVGLSGRVLEREFHVGFSGGESKKLELLKVLAMKPKVALLDEPDSGVDVDSLTHIAEAVEYLVNELGSSVLIVTHLGRISKLARPKRVYVMVDGRIVAEGGPSLVDEVLSKGYSRFMR